MTSRHEGCVSTMLTGSNFSIALSVRHFKGLYDENGGCKPKSTAFRMLSVLTSRGCGWRRKQENVPVFANLHQATSFNMDTPLWPNAMVPRSTRTAGRG